MPVAQRDSAFLNIPYDRGYEDRFLAYIAGLTAFGLYPRVTLELTGADRRLDRIFALISACRYSFHDLSLVRLDRRPPPTPRFNMPFELGLVAGWQKAAPSGHVWFVFESSSYRLQKSLSDLNGTDPFVYGERTEGILREIRNALVRRTNQPTVRQMQSIFESLRADVPRIKKNAAARSLFGAGPFAELVVVARRHAELDIPWLKDS
jgi:hypothetical protein